MNSVLLILGSLLLVAGSWPVFMYGTSEKVALLPVNPKPVIYFSLFLMAIYLITLVAAFFSSKISWWIPFVCFFVSGPIGKDLGAKYIANYIEKFGHFLVPLSFGAMGVVLQISAFLV